MTALPLALKRDVEQARSSRFVAGDQVDVLTDIYAQDCNLVAWRRTLAPELEEEAGALLLSNKTLQASLSLSPQSANDSISRALGGTLSAPTLVNDIVELVDMFCYLFDADMAGLRLTALGQPMCPRFHVDHVPCRLVVTYRGPATEWLPHDRVNRSKLGSGNGGKIDEASGLFKDSRDINQATAGDVLLLKGESWVGNEGAGVVHRSPDTLSGNARLLLTLDML